MKYAVLTILVFSSQLLFAQVGEIWKLSGSDVTSTLEIHSPEQEEMPVIYMKYSYDDGLEPAPDGGIIEKNIGLFNDGAFKIKYSSGSNYSSLVEVSNSLTKFKTGINIEGTSTVSGLSWCQDDMFIENGSIGIGVTIQQLVTMNEKLYVSGASTFDGFVAITENNQIEFGKGLDKQAQAGTIAYQKWSEGLDIIGAGESNGLRKIKLWDRVLIGESDNTSVHSDYTLAVHGKVVAGSYVATANGWPDYVFEKDYNLISLEELEKFIQLNKHLPNLPSKENVDLEGIELVEMNKILLEKVEELTLYLIAIKKEIVKTND